MLTRNGFSFGRMLMPVVLLLTLLLPAAEATEEDKTKKSDTTIPTTFSDGWISTQIELSYLLNAELNTFDVDVDVEDGVVHVIGYVPDESKRRLALELARDKPGVKKVVDKLVVDPDYKSKLGKGEILDQSLNDFVLSRTVKARLIASPKVTGTWISVEAEDGVVTLRGSVYQKSEIKAAEEVALEVPDVKKVKNEIICCRK